MCVPYRVWGVCTIQGVGCVYHTGCGVCVPYRVWGVCTIQGVGCVYHTLCLFNTPLLTCLPLLPDNELPDYIMVMLANKKSIQQINSDLQLFLGENTDTFTNWLEECILVEKQVPEAENGKQLHHHSTMMSPP